MTYPEKQGFEPSNFRPALVLGHRGTGVGPGENTLESFAEAVRLGADGVELDVRRTADGALAVHHDAVVAGLGPLAELRVRDLPPHVPLLDAALDAVPAAVVNIEVKNVPGEPGFDPDELAGRQTAAVVVERLAGGRTGADSRARRPAGSLIVSSFTPATLDAVLAAAPEVPVGLLTLPGADQEQALALAAERGYLALHPHHQAVTADLVAAAHQAGLSVNTWTVDDPERAVWLVGAGVDALITDRVAEVVAAVEAGGPAGPSH